MKKCILSLNKKLKKLLSLHMYIHLYLAIKSDLFFSGVTGFYASFLIKIIAEKKKNILKKVAIPENFLMTLVYGNHNLTGFIF